MKTLRDATENNRENNLNAIRLFLALSVIFSHSFPISFGPGAEIRGEPIAVWTGGLESIGSVAVDMFFFISGMLITASWLRAKSMSDYLMHRVLRIFPGFIAAVIFTALVIWSSCPEFRNSHGKGAWLGNFFGDWFSLNGNSLSWPGIFSHNPFPYYANASLWTIPREFHFYVLVALFGLFNLFHLRIVVLCITAFVLIEHSALLYLGADVSRLDERFAAYFFVGMSSWLWRDHIKISGVFAMPLFLLITLATFAWKPAFPILLPIIGSYLIIWVGYGTELKFLSRARKTDISYGVYLYAFPIQQLIAMQMSLRSPLLNTLIAMPIAMGLGWLSWHWIERRFLALKKSRAIDFDPALSQG